MSDLSKLTPNAKTIAALNECEQRHHGIHPVLWILAFLGGLFVVGILAACAAKFAQMLGLS